MERITPTMHDPIAPPAGIAGPPAIPADAVPKHVAIVMDGNGRWANERHLPRTEGHRAGEKALMDVLAGAVEIGVEVVSVYAFSTENWKRSPSEIAFLMNYSRDVIHRRRHELDDWGVKIVWSGRQPRLWSSVIKELQEAQRLTMYNSTMTLNFCCNYGGRAEIADAVAEIAAAAARGEIKPRKINEETIAQALYQPHLPDVDLFIRSGGEQRTSNFMLWQASYAEMMFVDEPWPEFDRNVLWRCIEQYASRNRRFGGAVDQVTQES
ncbi:isoprenyl transferase [Arcanobacterium haemolyticum]|uniref:isoprenyl transferase n=1 Tax=Arcanobacterium haemolyticum TaxID=28264 RepID=UPI000D84C485|nr:isoprenyl transferase [Arcanobacterium haemolyticum]SPT74794.1 Undecaprenyl pyrophosphate synthase [Arcanobacterium haemolyticum]